MNHSPNDDVWTPQQTSVLARALLYCCMKNTSQTSGNLFSGGLGVAYLQYLYSICQQQQEQQQQHGQQQQQQQSSSSSSSSSRPGGGGGGGGGIGSVVVDAASGSGSIYRSKKFLQQALDSAQTEAKRQQHRNQKYYTLAYGEWVGSQTLIAICHLKLGQKEQAKEVGIQLLKKLQSKYNYNNNNVVVVGSTTPTSTTTAPGQSSTSTPAATTSSSPSLVLQDPQKQQQDNSVLHGRAGTLQVIWLLREEYEKPYLATKFVLQLACQILKDAKQQQIMKTISSTTQEEQDDADNTKSIGVDSDNNINDEKKDDNDDDKTTTKNTTKTKTITILLWFDNTNNNNNNDDDNGDNHRLNCRLGASKGTVGILTTLLGMNSKEWEQVEKEIPNALQMVRDTIDQFRFDNDSSKVGNNDLLFPSGNLRPFVSFFPSLSSTQSSKIIPASPSSSFTTKEDSPNNRNRPQQHHQSHSKHDNNQNTVVDWANGGTGLVLLFLRAAQVFNCKDYLLSAHYLAETVLWPHCFNLRKGVGLAYGCSGVAFCFLELSYMCRGELSTIWNHRVEHVAKWAMSEWDDYLELEQSLSTGWNIYGLYEGMGGLVSLLIAMAYQKKKNQQQQQQSDDVGNNFKGMHMPLYYSMGHAMDNDTFDRLRLESSDLPIPVPTMVLQPGKVPKTTPPPTTTSTVKQVDDDNGVEADIDKNLSTLLQEEQQQQNEIVPPSRPMYNPLHFAAPKCETAFFSLETESKIGDSEHYKPALVANPFVSMASSSKTKGDELVSPPPPPSSSSPLQSPKEDNGLLWVLPNAPTVSTLSEITCTYGTGPDSPSRTDKRSVPKQVDIASEDPQEAPQPETTAVDTPLLSPKDPSDESSSQPVDNTSKCKNPSSTVPEKKMTKEIATREKGSEMRPPDDGSNTTRGHSIEDAVNPIQDDSAKRRSHRSEKEMQRKPTQKMQAPGSSHGKQHMLKSPHKPSPAPRNTKPTTPLSSRVSPSPQRSSTRTSKSSERQSRLIAGGNQEQGTSSLNPVKKKLFMQKTNKQAISSSAASLGSGSNHSFSSGTPANMRRAAPRDPAKTPVLKTSKRMLAGSGPTVRLTRAEQLKMEQSAKPKTGIEIQRKSPTPTKPKTPILKPSRNTLEMKQSAKQKTDIEIQRKSPTPTKPKTPILKPSRDTLEGFGAKVRLTRAEKLKREQSAKQKKAELVSDDFGMQRKSLVETQRRKHAQENVRVNAEKQKRLREERLAKIEADKKTRQAAERAERKKREDEARLKRQQQVEERRKAVAKRREDAQAKRSAAAAASASLQVQPTTPRRTRTTEQKRHTTDKTKKKSETQQQQQQQPDERISHERKGAEAALHKGIQEDRIVQQQQKGVQRKENASASLQPTTPRRTRATEQKRHTTDKTKKKGDTPQQADDHTSHHRKGVEAARLKGTKEERIVQQQNGEQRKEKVGIDQEKARIEKEKAAEEARLKALKEEESIAQEKAAAEAARLKALEYERIAVEKAAEAARLEEERIAQEKAAAEAARLEGERIEREKIAEAERLAAEEARLKALEEERQRQLEEELRIEQELQEQQRREEQEHQLQEELRIQKELDEQRRRQEEEEERQRQQELELQKEEALRLQRELEAKQEEVERIAQEKATEASRLEEERIAKEEEDLRRQKEKEEEIRIAAENERIAKEQAAKEAQRLEQERITTEKALEEERIAEEKAAEDAARLKEERTAKVRAEVEARLKAKVKVELGARLKALKEDRLAKSLENERIAKQKEAEKLKELEDEAKEELKNGGRDREISVQEMNLESAQVILQAEMRVPSITSAAVLPKAEPKEQISPSCATDLHNGEPSVPQLPKMDDRETPAEVNLYASQEVDDNLGASAVTQTSNQDNDMEWTADVELLCNSSDPDAVELIDTKNRLVEKEEDSVPGQEFYPPKVDDGEKAKRVEEQFEESKEVDQHGGGTIMEQAMDEQNDSVEVPGPREKLVEEKIVESKEPDQNGGGTILEKEMDEQNDSKSANQYVELQGSREQLVEEKFVESKGSDQNGGVTIMEKTMDKQNDSKFANQDVELQGSNDGLLKKNDEGSVFETWHGDAATIDLSLNSEEEEKPVEENTPAFQKVEHAHEETRDLDHQNQDHDSRQQIRIEKILKQAKAFSCNVGSSPYANQARKISDEINNCPGFNAANFKAKEVKKAWTNAEEVANRLLAEAAEQTPNEEVRCNGAIDDETITKEAIDKTQHQVSEESQYHFIEDPRITHEEVDKQVSANRKAEEVKRSLILAKHDAKCILAGTGHQQSFEEEGDADGATDGETMAKRQQSDESSDCLRQLSEKSEHEFEENPTETVTTPAEEVKQVSAEMIKVESQAWNIVEEDAMRLMAGVKGGFEGKEEDADNDDYQNNIQLTLLSTDPSGISPFSSAEPKPALGKPDPSPVVLEPTPKLSPQQNPNPFPEPSPVPSPVDLEPTPKLSPQQNPNPFPEPSPVPSPVDLEPTPKLSPQQNPNPFPEPSPVPSPEPSPVAKDDDGIVDHDGVEIPEVATYDVAPACDSGGCQSFWAAALALHSKTVKPAAHSPSDN